MGFLFVLQMLQGVSSDTDGSGGWCDRGHRAGTGVQGGVEKTEGEAPLIRKLPAPWAVLSPFSKVGRPEPRLGVTRAPVNPARRKTS